MTPYQILDVPPDASKEDIKHQFRKQTQIAYEYWSSKNDDESKNYFLTLIDAYACISYIWESSSNVDESVNQAYVNLKKNDLLFKIQNFYNFFNATKEQGKKKILKRKFKGILWTGGGILLSALSYYLALDTAANYGSGSYFIMYGAVIYGIIILVRAKRAWKDFLNEMERDEYKFWGTLD